MSGRGEVQRGAPTCTDTQGEKETTQKTHGKGKQETHNEKGKKNLEQDLDKLSTTSYKFPKQKQVSGP